MVPGFVALIIQIVALFLQVKLNPVVETNDFCSRSCLSNKDVFESTRVQAGKIFIQTIVNNALPRDVLIVHRSYVKSYTAVHMQPEQIIDLYLHLTRCSSVCGKGGTRSGAVDS